jgi:hypothetical protein
MYLTKDKSGLYIVADISLVDAGEKELLGQEVECLLWPH